MKYQSQNSGLLSIEHIKDGDILKIIEEAYMTVSKSNNKEYWNAKVELPDGSHKLANVGGITGDLFMDAWGDETQNWAGKLVKVDIRISKATGNEYIVLVPYEEIPPLEFSIELPEEKEEIDVKKIPW